MYRKDSWLFTAKIIRFKRKKLHISPKLITITLWALLSHLSIRPGGGGTVWGIHRTHLKWEQSNPEWQEGDLGARSPDLGVCTSGTLVGAGGGWGTVLVHLGRCPTPAAVTGAGQATRGGSGQVAPSAQDKPTPPLTQPSHRARHSPVWPPPGGHRPGRGSGRFLGNLSARPGRFGAPAVATEPEGRPTRSAARTLARRPLHSQRPQATAACPRAPAPLARVFGARPPTPTCWSHSGHDLVAIFTFLARVADMLLSGGGGGSSSGGGGGGGSDSAPRTSAAQPLPARSPLARPRLWRVRARARPRTQGEPAGRGGGVRRAPAPRNCGRRFHPHRSGPPAGLDSHEKTHMDFPTGQWTRPLSAGWTAWGRGLAGFGSNGRRAPPTKAQKGRVVVLSTPSSPEEEGESEKAGGR